MSEQAQSVPEVAQPDAVVDNVQTTVAPAVAEPAVESQTEQVEVKAEADPVEATAEAEPATEEPTEEKPVSGNRNEAVNTEGDSAVVEESAQKASSTTTTVTATPAGSEAAARQHNNKTGGRVQHKNNVKARYDDLPVSDDPVEIRKQAEFYFSDSNLPTDNFLWEKVGGSENNAVPISLINSFRRMRRFQPAEAVVAALKESTVLEVVEDDKVRRKVAIVGTLEEIEQAAIRRSIYAKGFGNETEKTQIKIEELFQPFGPINSVRLRRTFPAKVFKGSAFIEFATEEAASAFLALDEKPEWDGTKLVFLSKQGYFDKKTEEGRPCFESLKKSEIEQRASNRAKWEANRGKNHSRGGGRGGRGRGRGNGGRDRGGRDRGGRRSFDNKRKRDDNDGNQAKKPLTGKENAPGLEASA